MSSTDYYLKFSIIVFKIIVSWLFKWRNIERWSKDFKNIGKAAGKETNIELGFEFLVNKYDFPPSPRILRIQEYYCIHVVSCRFWDPGSLLGYLIVLFTSAAHMSLFNCCVTLKVFWSQCYNYCRHIRRLNEFIM